MMNADSIKSRLKSLAIKENRPFDYLLMHYFIERLLYRVSISQYSENFILKGGLLLYSILEEDARATKDIDFLARQIENTPDRLIEVFREICKIPTDDAVRYDADSILAERIKEGADYQGVRLKVSAYLDKSRHILQFDIGFGDIVVPYPTIMEYPSLLEMDRPKIKVYSLESVIAEKFEAMVFLAEANSRMKDFYDIYKLCNSFDFNGVQLHDAILATFNRRETPMSDTPTIFTEAYPLLKDKQTQWKAFLKRTGLDTQATFPEILDVIRTFLFPIYESMLKQVEFSHSWNHSSGQWEYT